MSRRLASVYLRNHVFFVHPNSETIDGVFIASEPCLHLPDTCSDEVLGRVVRDSLNSAKSGIPHPVKWTGFDAPLLRAANVRSWSAFARTAEHASVAEDAEEITVTPSLREGAGARTSYQGQSDRTVSLQAPSDALLGVAVRRAFSV